MCSRSTSRRLASWSDTEQAVDISILKGSGPEKRLTAAGGNFIPTTSGSQEAVVDAVSTGTISGIRSRLSGGVTSELPAPAVDMPQDATRTHLPPPRNPEEDGRREHD
jgi:hypothetical protein